MKKVGAGKLLLPGFHIALLRVVGPVGVRTDMQFGKLHVSALTPSRVRTQDYQAMCWQGAQATEFGNIGIRL